MPIAATVLAEDIEIYVGNASTAPEVKPNLMFIIDTSGSMDAAVAVRADYDVNTVYSGCFSDTRVYYSTGALITSCGTKNYFNKTALKCNAAMNPLYNTVPPVETTDPAIASGWYQDRVAQWKDVTGTNRDEWDDLAQSQIDRYVECKADSGVHGLSTTGNLYIANRAEGPYTAALANSLDWNAVSRGYVLYSGNYLNWTKTNTDAVSDRITVVKEVTADVVTSTNNINIGFMRFDSANSQGGPVRYPVTDVTAARGNFLPLINALSASGGTPLSEVLYENYLYWSGKPADYGLTSTPTNSTGVTYNVGSVKHYVSPIEYACQKNFNIYLSDGEATWDGDADSKIALLPGFVAVTGGCVDNCLDELAEYMHLHDVYDGLADLQTVSTYTVGFADDFPLLESAANRSGASYYTAGDAIELAEVFNQIIAEILSVNTTFSSPAVSVNAFNRTTHRNDLYFTLFKPAIGPHWDGNFKRFKLVFIDGIPVIEDQKNQPAINQITGFFDDQAYSYWTDPVGLPDGGEVTLGGAVGEINTRTVYTYTGAATASNVALNVDANKVLETNALLTKDLLNITAKDDAYRISLIQWMRGVDVNDDDSDNDATDARQFMGDPLHSEPGLVQYAGPDDEPDITAYVATNDGVLHAIDTRDGTEIFSFIPQEMLGLQDTVFSDVAGSGKAYGLDGSVSSLVIDNNSNGVIETGDKVYIYFGERRGGRNYYAMDVTDRANPVLMWIIKGGTGDFVELGQSWSNIQLKKLQIGGLKRHVAVFAGGYDLDQDANSVRTVDDVGRAIYIIDALTGARLWWAGPTGSGADLEVADMQYSIPARPKAVDVSANGYLDRIYLGDMGGQIWRVDIQPGKGAADTDLSALIDINRVASLSGVTAADNHRFYYPPDVAIIEEPGKAAYLSLAMSSGYRAHPLNTDNHDKIYMLRDPYVFNKPPATDPYGSAGTGIVESDLYDASSNTIGQGSATAAATEVALLNAASGWYIDLKESDGSYVGEKGLSEVLIIGGLVVATTYVPLETNSADACKPADGTGYVYFMSVTDATPKFNFDTLVDSTDNLTAEDRRNKLVRGGIPPNPAPIYTKDGSAIIVGTEPVQNPDNDQARKLFWYEDTLRN
ncbi:MAG: PilC/PilY family type IV pilus protein [Gammaproteobacteria bacterium]|nr:PilC/PilY family type IV pilus protein [Gammaproteobacteria bacterium]